MKKTIEFEVPGRPVAKERPRRGAHGNFYTPTNTREYEEAFAWQARKFRDCFPTGDLRVTMFFHFRGKPRADADNLEKAALDALQKAKVFGNDKQVRAVYHEWVPDSPRECTRVMIEDF